MSYQQTCLTLDQERQDRFKMAGSIGAGPRFDSDGTESVEIPEEPALLLAIAHELGEICEGSEAALLLKARRILEDAFRGIDRPVGLRRSA